MSIPLKEEIGFYKHLLRSPSHCDLLLALSRVLTKRQLNQDLYLKDGL